MFMWPNASSKNVTQRNRIELANKIKFTNIAHVRRTFGIIDSAAELTLHFCAFIACNV